ncbi:hypothetical protein ACQ4PT_060702 [Festuca glaucescens]
MSRTTLAGSSNVGPNLTAHELYAVRLGRRRDPNRKGLQILPTPRAHSRSDPHRHHHLSLPLPPRFLLQAPSTRNPSRPGLPPPPPPPLAVLGCAFRCSCLTSSPPDAGARAGRMAPSKQYDEGGQLQLMEADRVEEEEECFESIDKLISQGINAGDVKKLQDAGIYTCNGLMMHTKKLFHQHMADIVSIYVFISQSLTGIKGLSEAKVDKICEAAEKLLSSEICMQFGFQTQGFMTGSDLLIKMCFRLFDLLLLILKRKSVVRITTGSQALDELLGGGIETLCITEAFGEFRSGKTQLAHTLCVSTQLPLHMHGGNGKVAYIDTEGTFRPERIVPIAERFGMDANAVLDNIIYARAYTYEHQYNLLLGLAAKMAEEPFRLLIVDSVIALFRVDFSGRGELAERQQKLAQMLSRLTKIAEEFNVAVYITNQVIADPGGGMFITDPKKPAGGHVLAHAATIRLMLRKGKGEQRVCKIFDAPNLPEGEAISFYSKHVYCLCYSLL